VERRKEALTIYTHVSKCKNDKIKERKIINSLYSCAIQTNMSF
jgi:hypothetical protein